MRKELEQLQKEEGGISEEFIKIVLIFWESLECSNAEKMGRQREKEILQ